MEKLTTKILPLVIATALVAISTPALAGAGFRLNSKSPVPRMLPTPRPSFDNYVFGYGGFVFGSSWNTTGSWHGDPGDWAAHCPDPVDPNIDPTNVPINWELDRGWTFGGGLGKYSDLFGGSRFELEGTYLSNSTNSVNYAGMDLSSNFDIKTKAVLVNFLKEIPLGGATGYFGGGIGWAWTEMDGDIYTIQYSSTSSGFAWQLIAGIDFPITESLSIFTQYRYLVTDQAAFTTDFGDFTLRSHDNPASHSVLIGARVSY